MAVALAVENLTPQDLAELRELLEKLQQAQEKGDMEQIINVNRLFRLAIYHRSNMPILCEMIEQLWVRMGLVYIISMKRLIQRNYGSI